MNAKPITLIYLYDADDEEPQYETLQAYLVGEDRALFISDGLLWAQEVRQSEGDPDIYVGRNEDAGVIIAEDVIGSTADVVPTLIERWTSMTALEFIVRDLVAAPLLELGLTI
ncbi:hypothetical protein [Paenibacillus sp. VTT E-133291]|uniref:hypothetical protein n=1 Tax=Paenibacillus sp. VTT E-133291 TaxID=1986223 RepID=UPI000BA0A5C5|nr:hypothetical protein [Paenibacillus sp. VTT E-133291]OZQ76849.1 hypothetical protein CA598_30215 [Paenibacillus sp. VTT E-133291]